MRHLSNRTNRGRPSLEWRHVIRTASLVTASACTMATAAAQDTESGYKLPGMPTGPIEWTFNFDASVGAFGFAHSLYTDPHPERPSGDLTDNWMEGSVKPTLSADFKTGGGSHWYGKFSAVGVRTFGSAPSLVGSDDSSYDVEDFYIGWRSGSSVGSEEDVIDFKVGRAPYKLGKGMFLYDGASDGGTRGGYWTGARKAFEMAAIGTLKTGANKIEAFYLDKDDLPESDSDTKLWGLNYELTLGEHNTLGVTYTKWSADTNEAPQRDGLEVYNARAYVAPFPVEALSFEAEYIKEDNGALLDSSAWSVLAAYQLGSRWQPKISYRYALFEGDDPATSQNEAFDSLLTGFSDWGSWWQGEIAGEYFLGNSNLISHQVRIHATPSETVSTGLIFYDFVLDHPQSAGPTVTSDKAAREIDWYMDWSVNDNVLLSFVAAAAEPGKAVEQSSGRTDTFWYGMIFAAYSF